MSNNNNEIYIINEVCIPTQEQGIADQTSKPICRKCLKTKDLCKCK